MHLLIISPFPPAITGIGQYGYHITQSLARSGAFSRITVLAGSSSAGRPARQPDGLEIEYCWQPGSWGARSAVLMRVQALKPDLVWFNLGASIFGKSPWLNVSGLLLPLLLKRLGYPTIVTLHELVERADLQALDAPGGPLAPLGARLLTALTSQADVLCLTLRDYAERLAARDVDCVHIPIGAYHEPELLPESKVHELLFFTTLAPFKGLELLLAAFQQLRREFPGLTLNVAGADHTRFPDYGQALKSRYGDLAGLQWLGQVAEEQVQGLFGRAQIVLLPYTASTGSSSVLYQAATWGRPVVASDLPEICELVREANLEIEFFRSGDLAGLCAAIRTLLRAPERRRQQTAHNFRMIQSMRPEATCHKYLEAFNRALEQRSSARRLAIPGLPRPTA